MCQEKIVFHADGTCEIPHVTGVYKIVEKENGACGPVPGELEICELVILARMTRSVLHAKAESNVRCGSCHISMKRQVERVG